MLPFEPTADDREPVELLPRDGSAVLHRAALTAEEADDLFERLLAETPWQAHDVFVAGRWVAQPRLSAWYGDPGCAYAYSGLRNEPLPWTAALAGLRDRCSALAGVRFSGALLNRYRTGRDSMGWHRDDEPELGADPVIASVSLGAERTFKLRHDATREVVSLPLPHGSVLVLDGRTQRHWSHAVPRTARPVGERINVTFRVVTPAPSPG